MVGPSGVPYAPFLLPATYALAKERFDNLITAFGVRLSWMKSHACPCTWSGPVKGSPDPACVTCRGRAYYWDNGVGPFIGLMTFIHTSPTPDEPGSIVDDDQGLIMNGEPALTIPSTAGTIYTQASAFDLFVEIDSIARYNSTLVVGKNTTVPYQQKLTVAASGAVTIYDTVNHVVVSGISYTVSGQAVLLGSGYPNGTAYTVEYLAAPTYVAFRIAGAPAHTRPFAQISEPKRFRLQQLDLWLRARFAGDVPLA